MTIEAGLPPVTQNTLAYAGPLYGTVPCAWFERDPTTADTDYPGFFVWGNQVTGDFWVRTDTAKVWVKIESGSGHQDVPDGGTGRNTLTNHAVLIGAGTNPINFSGPGAAGTVLQGAGASADPAFSTATYPATTAQGDLLLSASANAITALTKNTSATRYLANTGASNNAQWDLVNLSNGVTGVLDVAHGGSGSAGVDGTATTIGATSADVITYSLGATAGTYTFRGIMAVQGDNGAGSHPGASYTYEASYRTDGATATLIDAGDDALEEAPLAAATIAFSAAGNNLVLTVNGVAGYTVKWHANMQFIFQAL